MCCTCGGDQWHGAVLHGVQLDEAAGFKARWHQHEVCACTKTTDTPVESSLLVTCRHALAIGGGEAQSRSYSMAALCLALPINTNALQGGACLVQHKAMCRLMSKRACYDKVSNVYNSVSQGR